jgi:hypothetical protein
MISTSWSFALVTIFRVVRAVSSTA